MKPVTIWKTKEDDIWIHNHIEDGHISNHIPTIKFPTQNGWKNKTWLKEFCYINENYQIVRIV
jgi:hypothetical protein